MPMPTIGRFLSRTREPDTHARERLVLAAGDRAVYVVGDVHGCLDALLALEERIVEDAAKFTSGKLIIMLGDYVDRGPQSAEVVAHLIEEPPAGFERICLLGNHEEELLDYLDGGIDLLSWLGLGSEATLASYGIDLHATEGLLGGSERTRAMLRKAMPDAHVEFMRTLPILVETERYVCVHAGLMPGVAISEHSDHDLDLDAARRATTRTFPSGSFTAIRRSTACGARAAASTSTPGPSTRAGSPPCAYGKTRSASCRISTSRRRQPAEQREPYINPRRARRRSAGPA